MPRRIEIRVSQVNPDEGHKRKNGNEHPPQQTLLAVMKDNYVLARLSVHRPEELTGTQRQYLRPSTLAFPSARALQACRP